MVIREGSEVHWSHPGYKGRKLKGVITRIESPNRIWISWAGRPSTLHSSILFDRGAITLGEQLRCL